MHFPLFIAQKYVKLQKNNNFVHIIGFISFISISLTTASLIIALSFFNGLESLTRSLIQSTKPDLKIIPKYGKYFNNYDNLLKYLTKENKIIKIVKIIEQNILARHENNVIIAKLKGVGENFFYKNKIKDKIIIGNHQIYVNKEPLALIGRGLRNKLRYNFYAYKPFYIYFPNKIPMGILSQHKLFRKKKIFVSGIFSVDKDIDFDTIIVPLEFAEKVCNIKNKITSLEAYIYDGKSSNSLLKKIKKKLPSNLKALDLDEQTKGFISAIKIEKRALFIVCISILSAAFIGIFFTITLLIITKKKDIKILHILGATRKMIFEIFFYSGLLISFTGICFGLFISVFFIFLQKKIGIITLGVSSSIVKYYPVELNLIDLFIAVSSISTLAIIACFMSSKKVFIIKVDKEKI